MFVDCIICIVWLLFFFISKCDGQLASAHHMQSALDEAMSYARFHPSKGYSWELKGVEKTARREVLREEPSSVFQRQRVDMLLGELTTKFPLPVHQPPVNKPAQPEGETISYLYI